ncbi:hypothetical protein Ddye_029626 [Dipteronia dyeriana]|uniref:Uncharacterized protein n=1 Tax=Dipteronia dyeriana TaxID=168575 RepID=A0AAD9TFW0_9ROSI|nr:hypothetical protein Ddye_029626 [Dipteronia dyeriana]
MPHTLGMPTPNKNEDSRKRISNGDSRAVKKSEHGEEDGVGNRVSDGAATDKRRDKKKQKRNPSSEKAKVSWSENSESDAEGSKKNPKGLQDGRKPDSGNAVKGKMALNHTRKSNSSEEGNFRQGKRKMESQTGQKGEKKLKKNQPGREVVDKLDMLIEQYKSKYSQQSSEKTDGDNQAPLKLPATDYRSWKLQFHTLLVVFDLIGFVEYQKPCPLATVTMNDIEVPNPAYYIWTGQDQLLMNANLGSISPSIIPFIASAQTAYAAWTALANTYAKPLRGNIMHL